MDEARLQSDRLTWRDHTVPVSQLFDDPYYSFEDGLAESNHVFLAGNGLPARFRDGFHIAELGFGTGLNAMATLDAWIASGQSGSLRLTSFEAFPMSAPDIQRALSRWPHLEKLTKTFLRQWEAGRRTLEIGSLELEVIEGDVRDTLRAWAGRADAWYLDGFSPAKNPEMWSAEVLTEIGRHTAEGGTFATYTAASAVRQRLENAGFLVDRIPGFGRKRHMTVGRK